MERTVHRVVLVALLCAGVVLAQPMHGDYTVKQAGGGDYVSFNAALSALSTRGQDDNVTFHVYAGTYNENVAINGFANGSYTVTFTGTDLAGDPTGAILNGTGGYGLDMRNVSRFEFRYLTIIGSSYGVYWYYTGSAPYSGVDDCVIADCKIQGGTYGLYLYYSCDNNRIERNCIQGGSYGIRFYGYSGAYSTGNVFACNMVYGWSSYGLYSYYHDNTKFYYNTFYSTGGTYAWRFYYGTNATLLNNILFTGGSYAWYNANANPPAASNYNCFKRYGQGPGATLIYYSGALTLAGWQSGYSFDLQSIEADPLVISSTDLHLQEASPCVGAGTPVSGITTDIDGNLRHATAPCIGADELRHDVGVTRIVAPGAISDTNVSVTPACSVYNYGVTSETYDVRFKAEGGYEQTATVSDHAPGTYQYIEFTPAWVPSTLGDIALSCSTELTIDSDGSNDRGTGTTFVRKRDMGAVSLTAPSGMYTPGYVLQPVATWRNYGNTNADFEAWMLLSDPSDARVYAEKVTLSGVAPGPIQVSSFPTKQLNAPGPWTARCSTYQT